MREIEYQGTRHQFPDDFTDADVAKALKGVESSSSISTATAGPPPQVPPNREYVSPKTAGPQPEPPSYYSQAHEAVSRAIGTGAAAGANVIAGQYEPNPTLKLTPGMNDPAVKQAQAEAGQRAGEAVAPALPRALLPNTPTQLAIDLATGQAGRAVRVGKAATKLAPPLVRQGLKVAGLEALENYPALARLLVGATAGEVTGELTGEPRGAGAGQALATQGPSEALMAAAPKVTQWLLRVGPGGKKRVNEADTRRVMGAVGEINPSLRGAETPEDVQKLVWREATKDTSGPGLPRMNAEKERVAGVVENRLPGNLPGTEASPGAGFNPPYDVKLGAGQIAIPSLGENGKPAVMTVKEANAVLSDIGDAMRGKKVLDPRYGNQDPARLYAKVRREISEGIEAAETGVDVAARNAMARPRWEPKHGADNLARELWEAGQTDYRKGRVLYDFLRDSKVLDQDGMLNMRKLQLMISTDPERAAKLQRALGEKDFEKFQQALFRGEKPMGADKPATGGGELLDPLRQTVAGTNTGSGNLKRSVLSAIGLPNLGTKYVGKLEPLTAPAWVEPTANVITKVPKGLGYLGEHVLRSGAAAQQRARDEKAKKKK